MTAYKIIPTEEKDRPFIYWLFEEAIAYQKRKNDIAWKGFDKEIISRDIKEQLQYKIVSGHTILCIFSICYTDPIIWGEKENDDAVYLHRVVVNPNCKGQKHFQKIMDWSIHLAKNKKRKFIRLDTWANNANIIAYYQSFGFSFVKNVIMPDSKDLPLQTRNLALALLEFPLVNQ